MRVKVLANREVSSFIKPNIFFVVGIAHARNKNIKRCTSLIKLPFLVFQNIISNCGPFKSTSSIDMLIFCGAIDEVVIPCMMRCT